MAIEPIDTHAHVRRSDPAFNAMLDRLNLHPLDIILVNDQSPGQRNLASERSEALEFIHSTGGRAVLCTSFDPYKMHNPGFANHAIRELNQDFKQGAIAVKIWKNIGMEIKDADGHYVLPDDPAFAPIYRDIAAHNKTLVAHVADPDSAWAPPDPTLPDYSYFQENPFWYMYGKPDPASKQQILKARDHILEQNPHLRVVGAHLGSMEADFPLNILTATRTSLWTWPRAWPTLQIPATDFWLFQLQELVIGSALNLDEVRHLRDLLDLAEVLAKAFASGEGESHSLGVLCGHEGRVCPGWEPAISNQWQKPPHPSARDSPMGGG